MPRQPRQVIPGRLHHIWFRGNNRRKLFSYKRDFMKLMRLLLKVSLDLSMPLHAWSLLPNHGHLGARPESKDHLALFMKRVLVSYARHRNRTYGGSGKVFEGRYDCRPAESFADEAVMLGYVELNGPLAGIVRRPEDHEWCSYRLKVCPDLDDPFRALWTPSPFWESLGANPGAAYRAFIERRFEEAKRDRRMLEALEPARRPDGSRAT